FEAAEGSGNPEPRRVSSLSPCVSGPRHRRIPPRPCALHNERPGSIVGLHSQSRRIPGDTFSSSETATGPRYAVSLSARPRNCKCQMDRVVQGMETERIWWCIGELRRRSALLVRSAALQCLLTWSTPAVKYLRGD